MKNHERQYQPGWAGTGATGLGGTVRRKGWLAGLSLAVVMAAGLTYPASEAVARNPSPPSLRAGAPNVYVVKRGDTLWGIAGRFLKSPWRWKEVWVANRHIRNPHWIYPGDKILLCSVNGRTLIGVDDGSGCAGLISRSTTRSGPVRVTSSSGAIPAVPLAAVRSWLTQSLVTDLDTIRSAPYVLAARDRRVITAQGDTIYVRGRGLNLGDRYGIYRPGERYIDPDTGAVLGYEARLVAIGRVVNDTGVVYSVELTDTFGQEVREDDRILSGEINDFPPLFQPFSNEAVKPGRLIRVMDGIDTAAINSVVAINRGEADGVREGQILAIYKRGPLIRDRSRLDVVRLPSERAGTAMVFRTFSRVSYALVLDAETGVRVGDEMLAPSNVD